MARNEAPPKGSGVRKAAILVLVVGDEIAKEIFSRLSEEEIQRLGNAASNLEEVSINEIINVLVEFKKTFRGGHIPQEGAGSVFKLMVERVLGEERARDLLGRQSDEDPFEACNAADPSILASVLSREHPQTVATVVASIDEEQAARVLEHMDPNQVSEILYRTARLDPPPEDVQRSIGKTLEKELESRGSFGDVARKAGIEDRVAGVLKAVSQEYADEVFEYLDDIDEEFSDKMQSQLFTFPDLVHLDPASMQRLLREVDNNDLAPALRGSDDEMKEYVYENMSERAADMLQDEIDALGPTPLSEVEEAQENIVDAAKDLEEQGAITNPFGDEGEML
jgi:flagellar motor switch protein FliG